MITTIITAVILGVAILEASYKRMHKMHTSHSKRVLSNFDNK